MDTPAIGWRLANSYATLPEELFAAATPAVVPMPKLAILNHRLAADLGLNFDGVPSEELAATFAGQALPPGAIPIAQAYAGHQYGGFTMLGDGRAILLGEQRTPSGAVVDVQLKGSGRTRYSRGGDGKAALGPMLREYIISEAMHTLGIPTTRSLAVVTTGEAVYRTLPQPGAILTRVAASHIRVGTFEYAVRRGESVVRTMADYAIARHDSGLVDSPTKYRDFFAAVCDRQAALIAQWQCVGFIHGVMNTDNMAISGETIDYGPCAFMNAYDPATVYSAIDQHGRYAFGNQPQIAQWNLARLAETLLPLFDDDPQEAVKVAMDELNSFPLKFEQYRLRGLRAKLGLPADETEDTSAMHDVMLFDGLLQWMQANRADFTNTFRDLTWGIPPGESIYQSPGFQEWHRHWRQRIERRNPASVSAFMKRANPVVIPRNHRVEEALAAAEHGDFSVLQRLLDVLQSPFTWRNGLDDYMEPQEDTGYRTHCGT